MFECRLHRALRNFVERNALNAWRPVRVFLLLLFRFLAVAVAAQFKRKMRCDGLAFAVRVRRQIDRIHRSRQLFQLGQNFFFARDDDVVGLKLLARVHAQSALRQILHVAERSLHGEIFP